MCKWNGILQLPRGYKGTYTEFYVFKYLSNFAIKILIRVLEVFKLENPTISGKSQNTAAMNNLEKRFEPILIVALEMSRSYGLIFALKHQYPTLH